MTFDLPTVEKLVAHYAALQGLAAEGWAFTCEIVPGLMHQGEPAWAVVVSDPETKTARVQVRDLLKTPLPAADPWFELKVTLAHETGHACVSEYLADPTIDAEEKLVERWAQALVRAPAAEAQIMARGWRAALRGVPAAQVRARVATRISACVGQRARGDAMDPETIQKMIDALKAGDGESALKMCEEALVKAASGGAAPPPVEPDGDETMPREDPAMDDPNKPKPGAPPAGPPVARPMARATDHDARARKAADSLNKSAIRARVHEVRVVEGVDLSPALEQMILAEADIDGAEKLLKVAALAKGDGSRARTEGNARPVATPPAATAKYNAEALVKEGIHPTMAKHIAEETDEAAADLAYKAARARIATSTSPWPSSRKPVGGVQ